MFIGTSELLLITLIALLLFGGKKLPELMKGLGRGVKEFKDGMKDVVDPIDELYSILCDRRNKETFYNFSFYIGFSKSNFNKMIRDKNEQ